MYQSFLRMLDSRTFTADTPWGLRSPTIVVTIVGIIFGGSLIGLIASGVDQRVTQLSRGRGSVIESGHSLILGWSDAVPRIIAELVIANESERDASIVVLARGDKTEMEDAIEGIVPDLKTTRVVVRQGDPSIPTDLERACINEARSIVIVRDEDGDAGVVKAVLAVRAIDPSFDDLIVSDALTSLLMAQLSERGELLAVFEDLFDPEGAVVSLLDAPGVVPTQPVEFATVVAAASAQGASAFGYRLASGELHLNPEKSRTVTLRDGDQILAIDTREVTPVRA